MIKTKICKGDKVVVIKGEGANVMDEATKKPAICTVLEVNRMTGRALLEVPHPKTRKAERQVPVRGVEQWKTARYNQKTGEAGGLKVVKRPVHVSSLKVVEAAPKRQFGK
ncbi:MAG TPA: hypothetical protein VGP72_05865 [Planctomycetota bacterium]|jgi:ribosomal protein L24